MKKMLPLLWQIMQQTTKLQEKWSKGKDLVGPAITCFPTSYLSLGSLSMTTKEHWLQCSHQVNGNLGLQRQRMGSLLKIWLCISSFKKNIVDLFEGCLSKQSVLFGWFGWEANCDMRKWIGQKRICKTPSMVSTG